MTTAPLFARYERNRAQLATFVDQAYIGTFGLAPCRMLDAGCGNGFWASLFAARGFTVDACDIDPEFIADGRSKYPAVRFTVADIEEPLDLGQYDLIFCRTLSHFFAEPNLSGMGRVLANLVPHLAPGGLLLCSAYTDGTGAAHPSSDGSPAWHHRDSAFVGTIAQHAEIVQVARRGKYLQVAARAKAAKGPEFYDAILDNPDSDYLKGADEARDYAELWAQVSGLVPSGVSVVELGCGTGRLASLLVGNAASYVGLDFAPATVEEAHRYVPGAEFRVADVMTDELPVADCYVMTEVLEHVPDDLGLLARIPAAATVVLTVPSFTSESHVRCFPKRGHARRRYSELLDIDTEAFVGLARPGRDFYHLLRGTRR